MSDFLSVLNKRQFEAATAQLGPILVLAGAGSGKTRVLTYRIAYLVKKKIVDSTEILALTFTNKAAGEMENRIAKLITPLPQSLPTGGGGKVGGLTMGTFHSVCARILRKEIEALGDYDRNFTIFDEDDALKVIRQILIEKHLSDKFRPQVFRYYLSQAKNKLVNPADLNLENIFFAETVEEVYEEYEKRLREQNALDFDDLLGMTYLLFSTRPLVLKKYQEKFKYVLVDEYQDTNHVQYMLLRLLVEKHRNIFVVGDDAQSIYGFRGANMQNILDFTKDFEEASVFKLEQNYRSTQNILDAAHRVIKLNPMQYEKKLWTENKIGSKVHLFEAADETDESEWVINRIVGSQGSDVRGQTAEIREMVYTPILDKFMKFDRPISAIRLPNLNDFVVLYRTHAQSRPFEEALLHSSIPYQIIGGIKFYERREIKDVLAYLRLLANPRDLVSLSRVINSPARGVGPASMRELVKHLQRYDFSYERLFLNLDKADLMPKALAGAKDFFDLLARAKALSEKANILELMEFLLVRSGYKDDLLDGSEEGASRWENIEELYNVAAKYRRHGGIEGVSGFLEEAALMTDLDSADAGGNKLTLMTLHSAKGLEFENVFFVGLEEGLLPHSRSMGSPQEIAEEIRLAYVGMTRAKKNLHLSFARMRQVYGELKRAVPSRILKAIPNKLIQKIPNSNDQ